MRILDGYTSSNTGATPNDHGLYPWCLKSDLNQGSGNTNNEDFYRKIDCEGNDGICRAIVSKQRNF